MGYTEDNLLIKNLLTVITNNNKCYEEDKNYSIITFFGSSSPGNSTMVRRSICQRGFGQ